MSRAAAEMDLIDQFFRDYRIGVAVNRSTSFVAGKSFAVFVLKLGAGTRIAAIESRLRELAEVISSHRGEATPVRLRQLPLALEVPHPDMEPLLPDAALALPPNSMALGKSYSYSGEREEIISLAEAPHVMIAGTTGSGKSKLLTMALWSLCKHTSPADLRLVLVDLKNEDLIPFADLPHVEALATSMGEASEAIFKVFCEKEQRIKAGRGRFQRWVLVIDELAEFAREREAMGWLASILAIGRSKAINVLAATQKPTAAVVGSVAKANFTLRLVGRVLSSDDSRVAGGQAGLGAEYLPGKGSFLRVDGPDVRRFQTYFIDDADAWIEPISRQWFEQLSFRLPEVSKVAK